jgi:hypothetical protein
LLRLMLMTAVAQETRSEISTFPDHGYDRNLQKCFENSALASPKS